MVQRAYTPVSSHDAKGYLELLIKVYHRTEQFPEGGKMTIGFEELEVGDNVEFKGPLGSFEWLGKGVAKWKGVERKAKNIGMICGGSGTFLPSDFLFFPLLSVHRTDRTIKHKQVSPQLSKSSVA